MENLGLVSSLGGSFNLTNSTILSKPFVGLPILIRKTGNNGRMRSPGSSFVALSLFGRSKSIKISVPEKDEKGSFARIASQGQETSSVGVSPQLSVPPPSSQVGSPLFWIGVGVGLSALFSWVAGRAKKYAMEQAFKTFSQQMNNGQNNPFASAAGSSPPFPFASPPLNTSSSASAASAQSVTVDVAATSVEDPSSVTALAEEIVEQPQDGRKKYAFVDVRPEETVQRSAFHNYEESVQKDLSNDSQFQTKTSQNCVASENHSTSKKPPLLSVDALEKMMEDPTVQKMVYPYLPEEMRNPTTFKWMMQNPQYRQQLQDMLNNMGGSAEWDDRMMNSLKNFDLSSPQIKQQFDQIGLTPEEVVSKIMSNPDVAMAFQNPRVQAAIMDCSQNPLSIGKYQNDKEVMDVFNKISELFPGTRGY